MPNNTFVTTSASRPAAQRSTAPVRDNLGFGDVFEYVKAKTPGVAYINVGSNPDRYFSVRVSDGALSGSPASRGSSPVRKVGVSNVRVTFFKKDADTYKEFRHNMRIGDVFTAKKDGATYIHLGQLTDGRHFALNLDTRDFATTPNGDKEVTVVGTGRFEITRV